MPGDRFTFAVRVRCQIDAVCFFDLLAQVGEQFAFSADRYIFWLIIILNIDAHPALGKVSYMTVACRHVIIGTEKLLYGLYLCGGLHNDQIMLALSCCCHFYLLLIFIVLRLSELSQNYL